MNKKCKYVYKINLLNQCNIYYVRDISGPEHHWYLEQCPRVCPVCLSACPPCCVPTCSLYVPNTTRNSRHTLSAFIFVNNNQSSEFVRVTSFFYMSLINSRPIYKYSNTMMCLKTKNKKKYYPRYLIFTKKIMFLFNYQVLVYVFKYTTQILTTYKYFKYIFTNSIYTDSIFSVQ